MTEFFVGDVVKVEMPRGYSNRGVLGVSLLFSTSPEARFDGATGTVTEINPTGPYSAPQFLVDFRTHDNSRAGLPWQAQWFREEWIALVERAPAMAGVGAAVEPFATAGGGGTPGVNRGDAGAGPMDADPQTTQAGGFSWGEDSELAEQNRPASDPPAGAAPAPEDGGYFGTPAVKQPSRDHAGEERGAGVVGPEGEGDGAAGSSSAATAELAPSRHTADTAELDPTVGQSGHSTGSVSGASTTAPSSPIGETEVLTTPTGAGEASADTAERYAAGQDPTPDRDPPEENPTLSRSGTALLDPSRVADFDESTGGTTEPDPAGGLARQSDGAQSRNQR